MEPVHRISTATMLFSYAKKRSGVKQAEWRAFIEHLNQLSEDEAQAVFLQGSRREGDPRVVFKNAGTWRALEVMYTFEERRARGLVDKNDIFWEETLDNARSIRNRLLLVKEKLVALVKKKMLDGTPVRVLSIGTGSARPVLEATASLERTPEVELLLVDRDGTALKFSEELGASLNVNHTARKTGNFLRVKGECGSFKPQIVEMVGLLDYLNDRWCHRLIADVLDILAPGGYLITGNISPNLEAPFVTKGINWPMIYRTPEELRELLMQAGFLAQHIRTIQEPLEVHTLAIAQK